MGAFILLVDFLFFIHHGDSDFGREDHQYNFLKASGPTSVFGESKTSQSQRPASTSLMGTCASSN